MDIQIYHGGLNLSDFARPHPKSRTIPPHSPNPLATPHLHLQHLSPPSRQIPRSHHCSSQLHPNIAPTSQRQRCPLDRLPARTIGEVVRVSPTELSFSSASAWKDIYGHRKAGESILAKNPKFYKHPGGENAVNIITADPADHSRMRRIFAHVFSDKALKMQEPLFLTYVNKLVGYMRDSVEKNPHHKFNMVNMYNFATFDVMVDLTFAEPLGMLDNSNYHPWVASIFSNFKFGAYLHTIDTIRCWRRRYWRYCPSSFRRRWRRRGRSIRSLRGRGLIGDWRRRIRGPIFGDWCWRAMKSLVFRRRRCMPMHFCS